MMLECGLNGKIVGENVWGQGFEPCPLKSQKSAFTTQAKHSIENLTTKQIYIL